MKLKDFELEVYFDKHEFSAPYLLAQSDCEAMTIRELLTYEPGAQETLLNGWLGYTEVAGNPALREAIAGLYQGIKEDEVIVHVGAQEAIFNFMNVCLNKGDHIISQFPVYQSLYGVAEALGCQVSKWHLKQTADGWAMDFDELEKLIKPNTRLICVNSPNNPTGYIFSPEEMKKIADIAARHNLYVFYDEVYKGSEFDEIERPWFADLYEKGVSLGVMSKSYGLAGLRIGWIATKDKDIREKMKRFKHYTSICSSAPAEELALIALRHGDKILKRNRKIIEDNLKIADAFFKKYSQLFQYNRPMAGPIGFHRINIEIPIRQFCDQLVAEKGVLLLPADTYFYDGPYFRMGFGRRSFDANLKIFEAYLIEKKLV